MGYQINKYTPHNFIWYLIWFNSEQTILYLIHSELHIKLCHSQRALLVFRLYLFYKSCINYCSRNCKQWQKYKNILVLSLLWTQQKRYQNIFALKMCKNNVLKVAGNKKGNFTPLILFLNVFTTATRKIHNEMRFIAANKVVDRTGFYNLN